MSVIAIVDYNMGNLRSVTQALEHVAPANTQVIATSDPAIINEADRVVFPGQGAARDCMRELENHNVIDAVRQAAANKPFLGICMGMQVLMNQSDENDGVACLGIFKGQAKSFKGVLNQSNNQERLKIPHMGWNQIRHTIDHPLWSGIESNARFYFVHSYYLELDDASLMAGETEYGINFPSTLARDNIFAMQSHPEKSADDGLQLLKNFTLWNGNL